MAHVDGTSGSVGSYTEITKWDGDFSVGITKYASTSTEGAKKCIIGTKDWKGSFVAMANPGAIGTSASLALDDGTTTYTGNAVITNKKPSVNIETGVVEYSCDFEGDGDYTEAAST